MIQSNQPITIIKNLYYSIDHILIQNIDNQWKAVVQTAVKDENGESQNTLVNEFTGEEYNQWWNDFNSGEFVIQKIIELNNLDVSIPEKIENEFLNMPYE